MIQNSDVVVGSLYMRAQKIIKEAQVLFFAPPMIPGYSASTDIEVNMQDKTGGDLNKFFDVVNDYTAALEARPEINSAKTSFNPNFPQYMIDIDAAACKSWHQPERYPHYYARILRRFVRIQLQSFR